MVKEEQEAGGALRGWTIACARGHDSWETGKRDSANVAWQGMRHVSYHVGGCVSQGRRDIDSLGWGANAA